MHIHPRPSSRSEFEIAIICALAVEVDAVSYVFDEFWDDDGDPYSRAPGDFNHYTTGRIEHHNVVLALLPHMGKASTASAAASLRSSYTNVRLALVVGVCGAVPHSGKGDVLLGDVIISTTVVQHDFGAQYTDRFIRKDTVGDNLGRPNKDVGNLLMTLVTDRGRDRMRRQMASCLQQVQAKVAHQSGGNGRHKYVYPGAAKDRLFEPGYRHKHRGKPTCACRDCHGDADPVCHEAHVSSCDQLGCDECRLVKRERLHTIRSGAAPQPLVHLGAAASGDMVIKSAAVRDRLAREEGIVMLEMEGAGVWEELPCIVVKGVCDYADSHKNKAWQPYAAATAASASKAILERYTRTEQTTMGPQAQARQQFPVRPHQENESRVPSYGPVFNGPISGANVVAGTTTTGGVVNFNFGRSQ